MARSILYDLDATRIDDGVTTECVLGDGITRVYGAKRLSTHISRSCWFTLEAGEDGPATVQQGARGGDIIASWVRIELLYEDHDSADITVEARLHDGAGAAYYWTGAAWAVAGASDWNTTSEVEANFASLSAGTVPRVGVEWRIAVTSDDEDQVPEVYGALIVASAEFAANYDGAEGRADSWQDDMIHRVLLAMFEDIRPQIVHEVELAADTTVLDFSDGLAACADAAPREREDWYDVQGVAGVYDLGADPEMRSPLSGTWDDAAPSWTADATIAQGTVIHVRVLVQLHVGFMAEAAHFTDKMPMLLIEGFEGEEQQAAARIPVRSWASMDALMVYPPVTVDGTVSCRIEAATAMEAMQIRDAVKSLLPDEGKVVLSDATGLPMSILGPFAPGVQRGTIEAPGSHRFDLDVRTMAWYGDPVVLPVLQEGCFTATISGGNIAAPSLKVGI